MMRWLLASLFVVFSLPADSYAATVLVMGDSLSAAYGIDREKGWVNILARRLSRIDSEHQVINASISGETTSGGVRRLPLLLHAHRPQIVVLALGANDGLRASDTHRIEHNLQTMIESAKDHNALILLIGIRLPPNYGASYNAAFEAVFPKLAEQHHLPLIPFLLKNVATYEELMQADRYHPTARAQPSILDNVWPELFKLLRAIP
jgi:acyl-CoA thioesterase-1